MKGHVFVVRGDISKLACDAWLTPCDYEAKPERKWIPSFWKGPFEGSPFQQGQRVQKLPNWPEKMPQPWLTNVGGTDNTQVEWYIKGVADFLETVKTDLVDKEPLYGRSRPLLAMPVVGTALGGALEKAGEILERMLKELRDFTANNKIDVAVVAINPDTYAAAQAERNNSPNWPPELTPELRDEANRLAERSQTGQLALFIGAGVSMAAGLPSWDGLLQRLAERASMTPSERGALIELKNVLDQATIIERRFEGTGTRLGAAVEEELKGYHHYALSHAFLASLPVHEVVTTNYDQLFESAWALSDPEGLSVIPRTPKGLPVIPERKTRANTRRWLLKMHGCVSNTDHIVLTRSNYTRYDENLPALAGIVQAFLITRHMLFVGFSLSDDNFHRIVESVRRIRAINADGDCFGTTLALGDGGLHEVLWEKDLHRVRMVEAKEEKAISEYDAPRRLEIFLDYLLSRTRDSNHLLVGKRFDKVLDEHEKKIRDALYDFVEDLRSGGKSIKETVAWRHIEGMLIELGFRPEDLIF